MVSLCSPADAVNEIGHVRFLPVRDLCHGKGLDLINVILNVTVLLACATANRLKMYLPFAQEERYVVHKLHSNGEGNLTGKRLSRVSFSRVLFVAKILPCYSKYFFFRGTLVVDSVQLGEVTTGQSIGLKYIRNATPLPRLSCFVILVERIALLAVL